MMMRMKKKGYRGSAYTVSTSDSYILVTVAVLNQIFNIIVLKYI